MIKFSNLDHEPLIKNNVIISAEETMMQNPSSSSSSSSPLIIHENPNTKSAHNAVDGVWNDRTRDPFGMRSFEEDFLQNPAPLMTKIDQEYMNWQQQEMMQLQTDFKVLESGFEKSADDSRFESEKNDECVERRQRRMIKNRESAARSRARKQAYINQLQHNASQLQTSNKLLKKRKEAYASWNSNSISAPRYQLRRTSSAHF